MRNRQSTCVQHLAIPNQIRRIRRSARDVLHADIATAIKRVADDRVFEVRHVYAQLMRATGLRVKLDERVTAESFEHFVARDGVLVQAFFKLAAKAFRKTGGDVAVVNRRVLTDGDVDDVFIKLRATVNDGLINFLRRAVFELAADAPMGFVGLGDHHDAGRVLIEPMNDAGTKRVVAAGQVLRIKRHGIRYGAALGAIGRVGDHVDRLVDCEQVIIFVHDIERDIFGLEIVGHWRREGDVDHVAAFHLVAVFRWLTIDEHVAAFDQLLDNRARGFLKSRDEIFIEARARQLAPHRDARFANAYAIVKCFEHFKIGLWRRIGMGRA